MRVVFFAGLIALALFPLTPLEAAPAYRIVKTVPLGSPDRWDFLHFDADSGRVYVAHGTEVTVVDAEKGIVIGRVANIAGSHDVAIAEGRGYADNGETGNVTVFDLSTFKPIGKIAADADADAMLYEPKAGKLFVANGDAHSVSIIDIKSAARIANVALPGSPEMMAADADGKIYINIASTNEIVRLDPVTAKLDIQWKIPACDGPYGLVIYRETQRLFVTCHNAKMLVVDAQTGKTIADPPIGNGTDGAGFDPQRKRAFSSNRDGTLSVIAEKGPNDFAALGNVPTAPGARTMAVDPKTGRVFLVTGDVAGAEGSRMTFKPGSAKLLILEPGK